MKADPDRGPRRAPKHHFDLSSRYGPPREGFHYAQTIFESAYKGNVAVYQPRYIRSKMSGRYINVKAFGM